MRYALVLVLVAGCRSIFGISDPGLVGDASTIIDATDGGVDGSPCTSFSSLVQTCGLPSGTAFPPTATLYNSDTGVLTVGVASQPIIHFTTMTTFGDLVDLIPITSFTQGSGSALRMTGKLPVALVATGLIEVAGHLDVSAGGAGAGCDNLGTGQDGQSHGSTGDGGGGGGGIVPGAHGGASNGGNTHANGGLAEPGFAGGCAGGDGGLVDVTIANGGGVVYLISALSINVGGLVDASGAGGKGGVDTGGNHGGGGGGGAGGSLIFEAPSVINAAQIDATGGGGGGGAGLGNGNPGKLGSAGGTGGSGPSSNSGGRGGNGTLAAVGGGDGGLTDGGGGGGGATGRIHVIAQSLVNTGTIAPPSF